MIVIVGCGGTGSNLAPMLSRMLTNEKFLLVDGDIVEKRNVERQTFQEFDVGSNKARALAKKLNSNFINEHFFVDKYIESSDEIFEAIDKVYDHKSYLQEHWHNRDEIIICGCVDNNKTRLFLEELFFKIKRCNAYYIDSGNESNFGTVLVSDSKSKNEYLRSQFVDMSDANDHPTLNCHRRILSGDEQQYQINLDMALSIAKIVFAIKNDKEYPHAIKINGFERTCID